MQEFSLKDILLLVFGGGGVITGLIAAGKSISRRLGAARKRKAAEIQQHSSFALESRRDLMSEHERIIVQWKELLEEKKHQIAHLQDVIQQLDNHQSLSRSTIQNLYAAFNALRRQINIMDTVIQKSD